MSEASACRRWVLAWLSGPAVGIANGLLRERTYGRALGEHRAHQASTATALLAFGALFAALGRRWPLPTARAALQVGGAWVLLTALFEFGFGHFVAGQSWRELAKDYNWRRVACGRSCSAGWRSARSPSAR